MFATIKSRLMGTFGVVLALLLAICATASFRMSNMNANVEHIVNDEFAKQALVNQIKQTLSSTVLATYRAQNDAFNAARGAAVVGADVDVMESYRDKTTDLARQLQGRAETDDERAAVATFVEALNALVDTRAPVYQALRQLDRDTTSATLGRAVPYFDKTQKQLDHVNKVIENSMATAVAAGRESYKSALVIVWLSAAGAIAAALVLGMWVTRSIVDPVLRVTEGAEALARGDLSVKLAVTSRDEVGTLARALGNAIAQLAAIVGGVRQSSQSIAGATQQLAAGNLDLSQRTEEQAASLEETASSMEELTAAVRHNAENAKQAATLAARASDVARRGGEVVGRVVDTMHAISQSSAKVTEIIGVIESIAFQTNILALNAAVEAARAGEQGRGFAVVATEVRTLAQRSANAAKEIKALIGESVNRVDIGSNLVEEAGATISEIVVSVKQVTDIIGEISSASEEQRTGIEQVNQAVAQMDQVTQQNAALVEEASAAAQSMADQAQTLQDAVAVFRIAKTE